MPGYVPPARPTVLEGDYSDWTIYDSFDDTGIYSAYDWENHAFFNREETVLVIVNENACKCYTIATKVLGSSLFDPSVIDGAAMAQAGAVRSAYGTYVVWMDDTESNIYIIKDGAVIKTMSYTDLGLDSTYIYGVNISPKGKYIAVAGRRTATATSGWVVLLGS